MSVAKERINKGAGVMGCSGDNVLSSPYLYIHEIPRTVESSLTAFLRRILRLQGSEIYRRLFWEEHILKDTGATLREMSEAHLSLVHLSGANALLKLVFT